MPNGAEEHHAQLLEPVGPAAGLVLPGPGEVGLALGEVGLEPGEAGRDDAGLEPGLCFGFGLCQSRCLWFGAGCPGLCFVAAST